MGGLRSKFTAELDEPGDEPNFDFFGSFGLF